MKMKKKTLHKKILFILLFGIVLISMSWNIVDAKIIKLEGENTDNTKKKDSKSESTSKKISCDKFFGDKDESEKSDLFVARYGLTAQIKSNQLVISLKPDSSNPVTKKALRAARFNIISINKVKPSNTLTVSYNHPATLNQTFIDKAKVDDDDTMTVELKSVTDDEDPECSGRIDFSVQLEAGGADAETPIVYETDPEVAELEKLQVTEIDCSKPANTFEKDYCSVESIVKAGKGKTTNYSSDLVNKEYYNVSDTPKQLYCSLTNISNQSPAAGDNGYYVNSDYLYAEKEITHNIGKYTYNFAPGAPVKETPVTCKTKCSETVEVKYGPPVATKAGLCFEYSIKVTSRVTCKMTKAPEVPKKYTSYCSPRPMCVHTGGVIYAQAGPNDDFDNCVESCDGGKYTSKCSKKCYNRVYGNKNTKASAFYDEVISEKLALTTLEEKINTCKEITKKYKFKIKGYTEGSTSDGYYGCYFWSSANTIEWSGGDLSAVSTTPGRWYAERKDAPDKDYSPYAINGDGFFRKIGKDKDGNRTLCGAKCDWQTSVCTKDKYLNPGVAEADWEANNKIYKNALQTCKVAESCQETTSTFKITVNSSGTTTVQEDSILSKPNGLVADTENTNAGFNYINSRNGCYLNSLNRGIWYQTEWSVPNSWISAKTGELTYKKPKEAGYVQYDKKFCLPMYQKDVNPKWWNYYYTKVFFNKENQNTSVDSDSFKNECNCNVKQNTISNSDISDWNIVGTTRGFGHFKWNINVNCFYAINSNTCADGKKCNESQARIRTVDLKNMFPNQNGSSLGDLEKTGRDPGFNWSQYATNTKKDNNYKSSPSEYTKWVQKVNYKIYSNDYLDYEVNLTRDMIKKIRNKKTDKSYDNFEGKIVQGSVFNYKSDLLRETLDGYTKYPIYDSALKCNNMKNWNSPNCEEGIAKEE